MKTVGLPVLSSATAISAPYRTIIQLSRSHTMKEGHRGEAAVDCAVARDPQLELDVDELNALGQPLW